MSKSTRNRMNKIDFTAYQDASSALPDENWAWNMYGKGVEHIGHEGRYENVALPEPNDDQMLVRVDSVGMCFSDVKLIRLGKDHPKLYGRDLKIEPTRLGHETAVTVIEVGANLADQYKKGQRLAIQPDVYQNGKSTAYGYTVPGGLIQYHLIGAELLETDAGACVLPLAGDLGYAETALLEPWGCVLAAYTQRRRLIPKVGGVMWLVGQAGDERDYRMSAYASHPAVVVLTNVNASVRGWFADPEVTIIEQDGAAIGDYGGLNVTHTGGAGFDDVIVFAPRSAEQVHEISKQVARRGTMNLVGTEPLDGLVQSDVGRLHYDYVAFVGTAGDDVALAYGEARNRCELMPNGVAVIMGAGGPMGQMHVQRAIELPDGPRVIVATELNTLRLETLQSRFGEMAGAHGVVLLTFNPLESAVSLADFVGAQTGGRGADDVVVCVPVASLMSEGGALLNGDGMLVLFAGVPNGTMAPLDLSDVYLHNAQFTGTSGLTIDDQRGVMERALAGSLSPGRAVAAIGGMNSAKDGIVAMMESRFPGKILIFPQVPDFPLTGLDELADGYPDMADLLGAGYTWTKAAERVLLERYGRTV